jgi:hypothetical protein
VFIPSSPYSRGFSENEQVTISTCNYCFEVVAASDDEAELEKAEGQHWCPQQARALAA